MIWLVSVLGLLLSNRTPSADTSRVWLVVGASDKSPAGIVTKAQEHAARFPNGLIFSTADCGAATGVLGYAAEIATDAQAAETALVRVRATIKDAYVKRCDVKPQSLLARRITAVDPSIARVPGTAVNWGDEDRMSTLLGLPDGRAVAAIRYFESDPEDPLEGKRTRLLLLEGTGSITLTQNCFMPDSLTSRKGYLAVQCTVGQAADNLLHDVVVFGPTGQRALTASHCREPRWSTDSILLCKEESVDASGVLKTTPRKVTIRASP